MDLLIGKSQKKLNNLFKEVYDTLSSWKPFYIFCMNSSFKKLIESLRIMSDGLDEIPSLQLHVQS